MVAYTPGVRGMGPASTRVVLPSPNSMDEMNKPVRSVLYMPGANRRALEKGRALDCDAIIMDLEDAVSPDKKKEARKNISEFLAHGGYENKFIAVRINGMNTEWGKHDMEMLRSSRADAIALPKVESAAEIETLAGSIRDDKKIWAMIETPLGVLNVQHIAGSHSKLSCLVMGTSDLAKEIKCAHTDARIPFMTSFGLCILAARAYGLSILDGVHLDLADDDGFERACRQAVELGFDGKTLIHPKTIGYANTAFAPTPDQLEEAGEIVRAHRAAALRGSGVVVVNGRLIENLHVEAANRLINLHRLITGEIAEG